MTLIVLGLDALDPLHMDHFDVSEFSLSTHGKCETFAHMYEKPHTSEVWPSVATGKHPSAHGVTGESTSQWDNPLVNLVSKLTGRLPGRYRATLGEVVEQFTGADWDLQEVDEPTFFDGQNRVVHNWPGVHRGSELKRAWDVFRTANNEQMSVQVFDREIRGIAAEQFGWLREMLNHDLDLIASHIHVVDAAGHVYRNDEERYANTYRWTAERVSELRAAMDTQDDMLILSDHGIETAWAGDVTDPGSHSWRAYSATTCETRPESVFDVREWVESHVESENIETEQDLDLPEQQLRDLGYI